MEITAELVKQLRERSGGAPMMKCKKALVEANGDIDTALEKMRKDGLAGADKKSGRIAAEGAIVIKNNDESGVILEVNCETDFVARDENFQAFVQGCAERVLENQISSVDALNEATLPGTSDTVDVARRNLVSKIGENIQVRRFELVQSAGVIGTYIHGGRIGVLVNMQGGDESLAKDLAMHIAASRPLVVNKEDVSQEDLDKEREIFTAQAEQSGKPAEIIAKMIDGRINKYVDEVSLMGQPFVKDPSVKVGQLLKSANAEVKNFVRFEVGEGIEKKEDNFVDEVMATVRDNL